ncbi:DUF6249 domain-containing protein [uncultured Bacteroides sp.]|mgnify:CR=1 FL=1|uniref:DUF6249 domain-containing protein n=1 Tax=uncultured Bacteroides sp. TaxID=162156 RepID=UPI0025D0CA00|nr:DUF6249 domain-containing protein [uncultured Bacteroides sp.]
MKQILIALIVAWTTCSVMDAQNRTTVTQDSVGNMKATVAQKKDTKENTKSTAITVIGTDTNAADTDSADADSTTLSARHRGASIAFNTSDEEFLFDKFEDTLGGGILLAIISVIAVFGLPIFVLFIIFFFRYKNRKARYRLAEQALAAGQPLPEDFIKENKPTDPRSQGIKNTFTGIGLFIFLWAITGELSIGTIGLLVMFMGLGQWLIGYNQQKKNNGDR